jgi:hypothetical protein
MSKVVRREPTNNEMTNAERAALCVIIRKREKVMKTAVKERSAEQLAEVYRHIATVYEFDDDAVWKKAHELAQAAASTYRLRCSKPP